MDFGILWKISFPSYSLLKNFKEKFFPSYFFSFVFFACLFFNSNQENVLGRTLPKQGLLVRDSKRGKIFLLWLMNFLSLTFFPSYI
jgi:hypothetical protein